MFRGGVDTFVLVINYLDETWTPKHVIVGLFKVHETSGKCHGFTTPIFKEKNCTNSLGDCFCER